MNGQRVMKLTSPLGVEEVTEATEAIEVTEAPAAVLEELEKLELMAVVVELTAAVVVELTVVVVAEAEASSGTTMTSTCNQASAPEIN